MMPFNLYSHFHKESHPVAPSLREQTLGTQASWTLCFQFSCLVSVIQKVFCDNPATPAQRSITAHSVQEPWISALLIKIWLINSSILLSMCEVEFLFGRVFLGLFLNKRAHELAKYRHGSVQRKRDVSGTSKILCQINSFSREVFTCWNILKI